MKCSCQNCDKSDECCYAENNIPCEYWTPQRPHRNNLILGLVFGLACLFVESGIFFILRAISNYL